METTLKLSGDLLKKAVTKTRLTMYELTEKPLTVEKMTELKVLGERLVTLEAVEKATVTGNCADLKNRASGRGEN